MSECVSEHVDVRRPDVVNACNSHRTEVLHMK
jgi:hypothetical protein